MMVAHLSESKFATAVVSRDNIADHPGRGFYV
jgi:hypothetical protein